MMTRPGRGVINGWQVRVPHGRKYRVVAMMGDKQFPRTPVNLTINGRRVSPPMAPGGGGGALHRHVPCRMAHTVEVTDTGAYAGLIELADPTRTNHKSGAARLCWVRIHELPPDEGVASGATSGARVRAAASRQTLFNITVNFGPRNEFCRGSRRQGKPADWSHRIEPCFHDCGRVLPARHHGPRPVTSVPQQRALPVVAVVVSAFPGRDFLPCSQSGVASRSRCGVHSRDETSFNVANQALPVVAVVVCIPGTRLPSM